MDETFLGKGFALGVTVGMMISGGDDREQPRDLPEEDSDES